MENKNVCFPFPFAANKSNLAASVFCLHTTNRSRHFLLVPFSFCRIQNLETWTWRFETWKQGDMTWKHEEIETWRPRDMKTSCGKRKPRGFSLILLPFFPCATVIFLFIRLLTTKHTEVICSQMDFPIYAIQPELYVSRSFS
jgi:hypothetical protein